MTQVLKKIAVAKSSNKEGADVDAKVLSGFDAQIGFYEAALLKANLQASAKSSRAAERVKDADEEEVADVLTEADAEVQALLVGAGESDPQTIVLAANHTTSSEPAKASNQLFAADNPLSFVLPAFLLGAAVVGKSSASAPAPAPAATPQDHCDIDFTFPNRPTGASVETIAVAAIDSEIQASDETYELAANKSLVVDVGFVGKIDKDSGNGFLVTVDGGMGDLYMDVGHSGSARVELIVDGGIGDIALRTGHDTRNDVRLEVEAVGDVGDVSLHADGYSAGFDFNLDTSGGDVGRVDAIYNNPNGDGDAFVSAYAVDSGLALVGGNVGDVRLAVVGVTSEGDLRVMADGGDVGNVEAIACGGSASGDLSVSAYAQVDGNGQAVGGNVGDVTVVAEGGGSAPEMDVNVYAYGILSSVGQYLGGGNIGNIHVIADGGSAEASAVLNSYDGGSIGNITIETSPELQSYSASANVTARVNGAGGEVASIGDVTMTIYGGMNNSGQAYFDAYSGGDIGTITATVTGGGSGIIRIQASAYANVSGDGGNIGAITVTDTSWAGDTEINLNADTSIGAVTVSMGGGSATVRMNMEAGEGAAVGDISMVFDAEQFGSAGNIDLHLGSAVTGANISVTGGSELSSFRIEAFDEVTGDIDMSTFAGFSDIKLQTVFNGVSIEVGQGGSYVVGTQGADTINLGAGSDEVDFDYFDLTALVPPTDSIIGFDAWADVADETDSIDAFVMLAAGGTFSELTADTTLTLADNDVVTLVDLADGDDISTAAGLLDALMDDGEYESIDGAAGSYTFATANATTATSFNLFHVEHNGTVFTNAYLLADVSMTGSTFADLSASNFEL